MAAAFFVSHFIRIQGALHVLIYPERLPTGVDGAEQECVRLV